MNEDDKPQLRRRAVARPAASLPMPAMPSSSGAWLGSRTNILRKDAAYVHAHAELLAAKSKQTAAMRDLIDARVGLAGALARMASIDEIISHEHSRGRLERAHQLRLVDLEHQRAEALAEVALAAARAQLGDYAPTARPASSRSVSIEDVEAVAQGMPELRPETIRTLLNALSGYLAEKRK